MQRQLNRIVVKIMNQLTGKRRFNFDIKILVRFLDSFYGYLKRFCIFVSL